MNSAVWKMLFLPLTDIFSWINLPTTREELEAWYGNIGVLTLKNTKTHEQLEIIRLEQPIHSNEMKRKKEERIRMKNEEYSCNARTMEIFLCLKSIWLQCLRSYLALIKSGSVLPNHVINRPFLLSCLSLSGSLCEAGDAGSVASDWDVEGRQQNSHPVQSQSFVFAWISIRVWLCHVSAVLCSFVIVLHVSLFSLIQVKETDAVVLAGAYVDLHGTSEASPENLTKVCQSVQTTILLFFSCYQIHGASDAPFSL